jgi:hypothetical protein
LLGLQDRDSQAEQDLTNDIAAGDRFLSFGFSFGLAFEARGKLPPGFRHLQEAAPIVCILCDFCERQTFGGVTAILFR